MIILQILLFIIIAFACLCLWASCSPIGMTVLVVLLLWIAYKTYMHLKEKIEMHILCKRVSFNVKRTPHRKLVSEYDERMYERRCQENENPSNYSGTGYHYRNGVIKPNSDFYYSDDL